MGGGITACIIAIGLAACSNPEFDGRTDTVISLETPSVTAKAYPGVNVVSWKPVTGANGYNVTVYEEGTFKRNVDSGNFFTDTELVNGKTYTYYVEAKSTTNPGTFTREVYATNSRGEASVKAIVPPAGTKSLELPAYENGYDGKNTKTVPENDNWVVKPSNITVAVADGKVSVNFPMKAYLQYGIKVYNYDENIPHELVYTNISHYDKDKPYYNKNTLYDSDKYDTVNGEYYKDGLSDKYANNVLGLSSFNIDGAGKYQIAIQAFALNDNYAASDEVIYGEVEIEKLKLDHETSGANAKYIYADNKIANNAAVNGASNDVRVSFTPATKDSENVPTSWYKVYRRVKGEYTNTLIGNVIEDAEKDIYYIDDKVPDVKKEYVYTIVVSNGGKYGKAATADLDRPKDIKVTGITIEDKVNIDKENKQAKWTIISSGVAYNAATKLTAYYWVKPDTWNDKNKDGEADQEKNVKVLANDIIEKGTIVDLTVVEGEESKRIATTTVEGNVYLLVKAERPGYTTGYDMKSAEIDYGN
ncbi:MAG: hypothetical protein HDR36_00215 [Treponema sp.]|nr:hypothetical protein [Treponema sp.]